MIWSKIACVIGLTWALAETCPSNFVQRDLLHTQTHILTLHHWHFLSRLNTDEANVILPIRFACSFSPSLDEIKGLCCQLYVVDCVGLKQHGKANSKADYRGWLWAGAVVFRDNSKTLNAPMTAFAGVDVDLTSFQRNFRTSSHWALRALDSLCCERVVHPLCRSLSVCCHIVVWYMRGTLHALRHVITDDLSGSVSIMRVMFQSKLHVY